MRQKGVTLIEAVVSVSIFSLLSILLFGALRTGNSLWRNIDSRRDALSRVQVATRKLSADIKSSSSQQINSSRMPNPGDGSAIWMLSSQDLSVTDPTGYRFRRNTIGRPEWQQNVIYYLVRPSNHDSFANQSCAVDSDPDGDRICPHKFLIRKVVDMPASPETLLSNSEAAQYLTPPNGFDLSNFQAEPNLVSSRVIATNMLDFRINHTAGARSVGMELQAVRLAEAKKKFAVGTQPFDRFIVSQPLTIFPGTSSE